MPAADLIARLQHVRGRNGKWSATCPAHGSGKNRALTITETTDGRVLLHCFGGCETESVLAAVGMTWADVMPEPVAGALKPLRRPYSYGQVARALSAELHVAYVQLCRASRGEDIDRDRAKVAAERIADFIKELERAG